MRKTKLFKRSAAVVISASMVLTSVNVIPELKEEAKAAKKISASMKKDELIAFAKENNIEVDEKATKAVIIETIEAALK